MDTLHICIYKGERNKTYIVAPTEDDAEDLRQYALARFKVSRKKVVVCGAWIKGDDLYLDYPDIKGARRVWCAYKRGG